jgi:uncharacterized protein (DUF1501 family)
MVSRRQVLKAIGVSAAGAAISPFMPRFYFDQTPRAHAAANDVFIILYAVGGWDGNHHAQPLRGPAYDACRAARPTLTRIPDSLLPLSDDLGLHQRWQWLRDAYLSGEALVCSTAGILRNNSGSHEEATGHAIRGQLDGNQMLAKGFFARVLDAKYGGGGAPDFVAFNFAGNNSPLVDSGVRVLNASSITNYGFNQNFDNFTKGTIYSLVDRPGLNPHEEEVRRQMISLQNTEADLRAAVGNTSVSPAFPNTGFGNACRQAFVAVANFANRGLNAITMSIGGWDTHNMQDPSTAPGQALQGMSAGINNIDTGLRALVDNLKRVGMYDRVTIMTLTEFGRTARENGGRGTDHGWGTFMFMAGGKVNGRQILGGLVEPSDFTSSSNSFRVTVPYAAVLAQCAEHLGVSRNAVYDPALLASLPSLPPLFRA